MKGVVLSIFFLVLLRHGNTLASATCTKTNITAFGVDYHRLSGNDTKLLQPIGGNMYRSFSCFSYLMEGGLYTLMPNLTVDLVRQRPDYYIQRFNSAPNVSWEEYDTFTHYPVALGAKLLLGHLEGATSCLPDVQYEGAVMPLDPNYVGYDEFMAYAYLFTRAIVRRYKDIVGVWQLDNEANAGPLNVLGGVRYGPPLGRSAAALPEGRDCLKQRGMERKPGSKVGYLVPLLECWRASNVSIEGGWDFLGYWANYTFLTEYQLLLREAVLAEDPGAVIMVNALTDIKENMAAEVGIPSWQSLFMQWWKNFDIIGLDSYPNHVAAMPVQGHLVGEQVSIAMSLNKLMSRSKADYKPVWVVESGYPAFHAEYQPEGLPACVNFTTANQAQYFEDAIQAASQAGASGFIAYGGWQGSGMLPPPGGISPQDADFITALNATYTTGDVVPLIGNVLSNLTYALDGRAAVMVEWVTGVSMWELFGRREELTEGGQAVANLFHSFC